MNQNKADEALPYFEKAVKNFPDKGDGYYYRGLIRLQKGDTEGTKADLKKFLELSPNAPGSRSRAQGARAAQVDPPATCRCEGVRVRPVRPLRDGPPSFR